jgi:hypothetical protein
MPSAVIRGDGPLSFALLAMGARYPGIRGRIVTAVS